MGSGVCYGRTRWSCTHYFGGGGVRSFLGVMEEKEKARKLAGEAWDTTIGALLIYLGGGGLARAAESGRRRRRGASGRGSPGTQPVGGSCYLSLITS